MPLERTPTTSAASRKNQGAHVGDKGEVARDSRGFILTGADLGEDAGWPLERNPFLLETSMPGVFAAGDVRHGSVKRVASAVGDGSIAIQLVHQLVAEARLHTEPLDAAEAR